MPSVPSEGAAAAAGVEGTPDDLDWGRFIGKAGPLIRHALRRATFPVGEGCLRRGLVHRGTVLDFLGSPPHLSRLRRATLSKQERAFVLIV